MFRCNLPPALSAEWPGSFTCHCGNTGVEQTPNNSQHTKLTLEKKFFCRSCQDSNSQPFNHKSGTLTNKLSQLPTWWNISMLIMLFYQHHPFKPGTGRTQWLLIQGSIPFSSLLFFFFKFLCWYMFMRHVHKVLLFLTNKHVRNITCKLGSLALTSLTWNLFSQTNTNYKIYWTKKCYTRSVSDKISLCAKLWVICVPCLQEILKLIAPNMPRSPFKEANLA